jgi:CTP-dependent riboflavin kinase
MKQLPEIVTEDTFSKLIEEIKTNTDVNCISLPRLFKQWEEKNYITTSVAFEKESSNLIATTTITQKGLDNLKQMYIDLLKIYDTTKTSINSNNH